MLCLDEVGEYFHPNWFKPHAGYRFIILPFYPYIMSKFNNSTHK